MDTKVEKYACPVEVTIATIGGKWKCLILWWLRRDARRFSELKLLIPRISPKVLTHQLRELEQAGLVCRESYPETPPRVEYTLTPQGQTFVPITELMCEWGRSYQPDYQFNYCRLEGLRVLVATPNAESICSTLTTHRMTTIAATSAEMLLTLFHQVALDAVLVDLSLLNAVTARLLMAQQKQIEVISHHAPVLIAMLPQHCPEERRRAIKLGFAAHIPTPIDRIEMISTIASLVGQTTQ
jgi:DNA-binding HxlR family transcriptional regulator/CheY-like chemotaxis protein